MKSSEILKDYIDRGLQSGYTGVAITDVLKEALILMEMKEQDRLIGLPVSLGTKVWSINKWTNEVYWAFMTVDFFARYCIGEPRYSPPKRKPKQD